MDIIYKKALEVSGGDKFKAKFISLLMTDLRGRGPCGAIRGKRGQLVVPQSIFDGEAATMFDKNRLDASQHFFGYALMQHLTGGSLSPVVSYVGKQNQYYFPRLSNFFNNLHGGADPSGDWLRPSPSLTSAYQKKERLRIDIERDLFYNSLGSEFGNKESLPSEVINNPKQTERKQKLGLRVSNVTDWEAYDPYQEAPKAVSLPPEARRPELAAKSRWTRDLLVLRATCEHSDNDSVRFHACKDYNQYIQKEVEGLYDRNARRTELRQGK